MDTSSDHWVTFGHYHTASTYHRVAHPGARETVSDSVQRPDAPVFITDVRPAPGGGTFNGSHGLRNMMVRTRRASPITIGTQQR